MGNTLTSGLITLVFDDSRCAEPVLASTHSQNGRPQQRSDSIVSPIMEGLRDLDDDIATVDFQNENLDEKAMPSIKTGAQQSESQASSETVQTQGKSCQSGNSSRTTLDNDSNAGHVTEKTSAEASDHAKGSSCEVCAKIVEVFKTPYTEENITEIGRVQELLDSNCQHAVFIRDLNYRHGKIPRYWKRTLSVRTHEQSSSIVFETKYRDRQGQVLTETGYYDLEFREDVHGHHGMSKILDSDWIDDSMVRNWMERCQKHHAQCEMPSWLEGVEQAQPLYLIDVVKGCLVPCLEKDARYITLSYTWGRAKTLRCTKGILNDLLRPGALTDGVYADQIPRTIKDCMGVVKCLGERYLWVDAICIVQDDGECLSVHLGRMHLIYASSFITIIAAEGKDADFGLPGFSGYSRPREARQTVFELAGGERLTLVKKDIPWERPEDTAQDYFARAWTYQEQMFAKRNLIFESGGVQWTCQCDTWREDQLIIEHKEEVEVPLLPYSQRWLKSRVAGLERLSDVARYYNLRSLSYAEDVLSGFTGIQSMLHRLCPGGLVFGHPELFFDITLLWRPEKDQVQRRVVSHAFKGDMLRNRLPSWSWMGWKGEFIFPPDLEFQIARTQLYEGFQEPVAQWYTMETPTSTNRRKIESHWFEYKQKSLDATAEPLAEWRRHKYTAPEWKTRRDRLIVPQLPKNLPRYFYTHDSEPDCQFWYQVPVLNWRKEPLLRQQTQYLYCQTSRAYLRTDPRLVAPAIIEDKEIYVQLREDQGALAGVLYLHNLDDWEELMDAPETKVELIAIVKGYCQPFEEGIDVAFDDWRPSLKHKEEDSAEDGEKQRFKGNDSGLEPLEKTVTFDSDTGGESQRDSLSIPDDWKLQRSNTGLTDFTTGDNEDSDSEDLFWDHLSSDEEKDEYWKEDKVDCYHVLWIEWKNGIAYRRASGSVLVEIWERQKEPQVAEIILG